MTSPIIIDLDGQGYQLSDASGGVWFRVFPVDAMEYQVAWPVVGSKNGWLVLDRNGNGVIDDFGEFFGDQTSQPDPPEGSQRNGFAALSVYDQAENGGNEDGWISGSDAIFDKLRLWIDENHDGISQASELHTLDSVGISEIGLKYTMSQKKDRFGNLFRFRSTIVDTAGGTSAKVIYDVFLTMGAGRLDDSTANWFASPPVVDFVNDASSN